MTRVVGYRQALPVNTPEAVHSYTILLFLCFPGERLQPSTYTEPFKVGLILLLIYFRLSTAAPPPLG